MRKYLTLAAAAAMLLTSTVAIGGSAGTISVRDGNNLPQNYGVFIDEQGNMHATQAAFNRATTNGAVKITTGGTYQTILAAANPGTRMSLTVQNNQISGTDVCYLIFGTNIASQMNPGTTTTATNLTVNSNTVTAAGASLILNPGQAYTRYYPLVPSDAFYATCSTTGDYLYVDTQ